MAIFWPFRNGNTCNQITMPMVYDESLSIAQQIACIMGKVQQLETDEVTQEMLEQLVQWINQDQAEQTTELKQYSDNSDKALEARLIAFIQTLEKGMLTWDVTHGRYTSSVEAMRNLFNDVTLHAITVDTLNTLDLTVDGLADCGLNVRGLAVYSGWLLGEDFTPEDVTYVPPETVKLTCGILAEGDVKNGFFVEGGGVNADPEL